MERNVTALEALVFPGTDMVSPMSRRLIERMCKAYHLSYVTTRKITVYDWESEVQTMSEGHAGTEPDLNFVQRHRGPYIFIPFCAIGRSADLAVVIFHDEVDDGQVDN